MSSAENAYHELCGYTLTHGDAQFIHQHVVDAWAVQSSAPGDKPIRLVFALAGLYLHLERGKTGREVQWLHMQMARRRRDWPAVVLPDDRGALTAIDVMQASAGEPRDAAIEAWCASVWKASAGTRAEIVALLADCGIQ